MQHIEIYDTTLRDGAQMRGISFSVNDKLKILQVLDELGVDYVEGGWPGANPKDVDFFEEAKKLKLSRTKLVAFGSTRKANSTVEEDVILKALLRADTEVVCIVSKSSAEQIENTMSISLEDNLVMLKESVDFLRAKKKKVFVDAEHFFDGYKSNKEYSHKFIEAAVAAKVDRLVLCDTNGGSLPEFVYEVTKELVTKYGEKIKFGIHVHNDSEMAVANSIQAVLAGAVQVQGTINGYGERCGNANIVSIIPNLQLKYLGEYNCIPEENLKKLTGIARKIAEIANMNINQSQPFVGERAFTHKGGLHASAIAKDKSSYEHIDPHLVGNQTRVVVSDQSGVSNVVDWLNNNEFVFTSEPALKELAQVLLTRTKNLEHKGYSFENAAASFELMVRNTIENDFKEVLKSSPFLTKTKNVYPRYFELIENNVHVVNGEKTEATVRIKIGSFEKHSASLGNGPANALDNALRKALRDYYPEIDNFQLLDFKVRILDSHLGTGAITKVQVTTGNKEKNWDTIGVSSNIIKASWDAIVQSIEYGLLIQGVQCINVN